MYRVISVLEARYCLDLQIMPITLDVLAQIVVMCGFHERFSLMIIPRNLLFCTLEIGVPFILICMSSKLTFLREGWKKTNLVFSGWRVSLLALNQVETMESSLFTVLIKVVMSL